MNKKQIAISSIMAILVTCTVCVNGLNAIEKSKKQAETAAVIERVEEIELPELSQTEEKKEASGGVSITFDADEFKDAVGAGRTDERVIMRNSPKSDAKMVCCIPAETAVEITGVNKCTDWYRVKYDGDIGYIAGEDFVKTTYSDKLADIQITKKEKAERIKSVMEWEVNYDEEIENTIINEINKLPDTIFEAWWNVEQRSIHVVKDLPQCDTEDDATTIACIQQSYTGGTVVAADIFFENNQKYIKKSALHEFGHFVERAWREAGGDASLERFDEDSERFAINECNSNMYYHKHSGEYFAELFQYTINNGATDEYPDTYKLEAMIKVFAVLQADRYAA